MDPISFLLGFTRALVPPMAPPIVETTPKPAVTNLGLDRDLLKAIYADSRVQATKTKVEAATPPAQGASPGGPTPKDGPTGAQSADQGAQAATEQAQATAQAEPNKDVQRVQQVREASRVEVVDAAHLRVLADPLMVAAMKALYADRLTLGGTAYERQLAVLLAASNALPWER